MRQRVRFGCIMTAVLAAFSPASAQTSLLGWWRVERGRVAPWVPVSETQPDANAWIGRTVRFDASTVTGPGTLHCGHARYEVVAQPARGVFQGNLPQPADTAAQLLGMVRFPVPGVRLDCDKGSFDFHRVDQRTVLIAVNNVIWTFIKAPGAFAASTSPSGVVQGFLEQHFAGDMGFDRASVAKKQQWMTDRMRTAIAAYFARPTPTDGTPIIDGDPYTDSQEYPTRFAVANAVVTATGATVSVRFSDGYRDRVVVYALRRERGAWRVADVRYDHGDALMAQIK